MPNPPTGTVTFLFTDIEGSTRLTQQYPDAIAGLLECHNAILRAAIESHGGYIFHIIGDAFCAAFHTVHEALEAALEAQHRLQAEPWMPAPIPVRMGISTGTAQIKLQEGCPPDYSGYLNLARVQRIMSVAYGGQILLAGASAELARGELPSNVTLRDLGDHRLKSLLNPEHLWQVIAPGLRLDFPVPKSLNAIPNNLPLQLTSFIGREHEIENVKNLLEGHRLVTLTGAGGTGKSRLSLQVAAEVLDQFHNGVWFVELAPITDPALISQTVIRILGLSPEPGREPLDTLKDYLADQSMLLILDNCEHLLDDSCRFAEAVLTAASHVKIMPTSREALNLAGEQAYRVPSLAQPDLNHLPPIEQLTQYEAVHLFIERAALVSPRFVVTNDNAPAVAQICHRLDGIPLAIELAAARVKSMPLDAIVSRLDDRFRLLTGGSRTALPRQQTLRAMIDWSYALLSEPEKLLLRCLSVFRGSWTLQATEAVCTDINIEPLDVDDLLSKLVDKSLVSLNEHERYYMLETVRQYGEQKLLEARGGEILHQAHLEYYAKLAEAAEKELYGRHQKLWFDLLDAEHGNLRAAIEWALEAKQALLALRIVGALHYFWWVRGYHLEGLEVCKQVLGRFEEFADTTEGARARAKAYAGAGYLAIWAWHDYETGRPFLEKGLQLARKHCDQHVTALSLDCLAFVHIAQRDYALARALLLQALDLYLLEGDKHQSGRAELFIGDTFFLEDRPIDAIPHYEAGIRSLEAVENANYVCYAFRRLGYALLKLDRADQARELFTKSLQINYELKEHQGVAACLLAFASLAFCNGDQDRAARLVGAAENMLAYYHTHLILVDNVQHENRLTQFHQTITRVVFEKAWADGRAMSEEEMLAYALEESEGS